jgi:hypothetical protein
MRLTVTHHVGSRAVPAQALAGAAFWVRVGSGLASPAAVTQWRNDFSKASATVDVTTARMAIRVAGQDGAVAVTALAPFQAAGAVEPVTPRNVLACDGDDLGARLLGAVEPARSMRARRVAGGPIAVPAVGGVAWEAEAGVITPPMTPGEDGAASKGVYVWMPAQPGEKAGSSVGRTRYELTVAAAGPRYVWGRVLTVTPENDSFLVAASTEQETVLEPTAWPTGVHKTWTWVRFTPEAKTVSAVTLPKGEVTFEIRVREAGAKLDRLFLTTDPKAQPPQ